MKDVDLFADAFDMHISGPVAECECGKVYWDSYNSGYDWGEGERERLANSSTAIAVPYGVQRIELEGHIYCSDCTCWHNRATRIIAFLRDHQRQIGEWFRLEKRRLTNMAEEVPAI